MSALKLTATASSFYVRTTASKPKPKPKPLPFFFFFSRTWPSSTTTRPTITYPQPTRRTLTPCANIMLPPSLSFTRKSVSFSPDNNNKTTSFSRCTSSDAAKDPDAHNNHRNESGPGPGPGPVEPSKVLTLPTMLTLGRVASVPVLVATFYVDAPWGPAATTSIFIAAAVTDWLDGYLARKMKLKSSFGAFLDPVADKLMVAATLLLLCSKPLDVGAFSQAPWLLTIPSIAIIGREITMSAVREWAASQDSKLLEAVAVNNLGKWKTATQMTALTILLATRGWSDGGATLVVGSGIGLLYTSAGLAVLSLVVYMKKIWKVLMK
ncbi:CDP-diacylglycerol-glycerol-3-phosphate 3-phosphatidyltransferase, mitochondrial [Stylosanthes scabra]|uniref:CDP-diacylglycerol-glycerol-3-phosphate 3-phosphatidyltransferase, mitochondrial n=1 Tax=Stylosanthes scabra TaxID=79078 RepID=A0ABU6SEX0_9FABA|nr:CDP-diacylglycerol-glycerol-3-phosphate 3-phosphatidyltransferase, mitochondrial [Stylosanthes scabra]